VGRVLSYEDTYPSTVDPALLRYPRLPGVHC
jgi:hypothetical protein